MAELQLIIPYRTKLTRAALVGVIVFLPFWSLVLPAITGMFMGWAAVNYASCPPLATALILAILIGSGIFSFFVSALAEEDRINVSKNGISFPPCLMPLLQFRRNRFWNELVAAELVHGSDPSQRTIVLSFASGVSLPLRLKYLKNANIEELLLAVELWGTNCLRSKELVEYQNDLQNENKGLEKISYTQMWEEELGRRFSATAFLPLEPGHKLRGDKLKRGQLEVVRQLAFGGLSAIYLVQRDGVDMFVLKEAVVPLDADPEQRQQAEQHLARESQMLFCLLHPNIAHVIDYFVEDGRHYLLLEHVNGQDLQQLVKQNGPQTEAQVIAWALQIADALEFVHSQNPPVIHRDVTPDNIVLKNDGTVVLIDFGAANEFIGTATGTLVGKQAYIAPEQLRGKAAPQSDLYGMGGTLYYLLTGREPVPLSESDTRSKNPAVSEAMHHFILCLTRFERKERIQSASQAKAELTKVSVQSEAATKALVPE